ncbi:MAG: hypothetical protein WB689_22520 [Xanthobacteraceae bacterium]
MARPRNNGTTILRPLEVPTHFEFVVNLGTAKALRLDGRSASLNNEAGARGSHASFGTVWVQVSRWLNLW